MQICGSQIKEFKMAVNIEALFQHLMKDPDIIPPEGESKKDIAIALATQRAKQASNNEKALNMAVEDRAVSKLLLFLKADDDDAESASGSAREVKPEVDTAEFDQHVANFDRLQGKVANARKQGKEPKWATKQEVETAAARREGRTAQKLDNGDEISVRGQKDKDDWEAAYDYLSDNMASQITTFENEIEGALDGEDTGEEQEAEMDDTEAESEGDEGKPTEESADISGVEERPGQRMGESDAEYDFRISLQSPEAKKRDRLRRLKAAGEEEGANAVAEAVAGHMGEVGDIEEKDAEEKKATGHPYHPSKFTGKDANSDFGRVFAAAGDSMDFLEDAHDWYTRSASEKGGEGGDGLPGMDKHQYHHLLGGNKEGSVDAEAALTMIREYKAALEDKANEAKRVEGDPIDAPTPVSDTASDAEKLGAWSGKPVEQSVEDQFRERLDTLKGQLLNAFAPGTEDDGGRYRATKTRTRTQNPEGAEALDGVRSEWDKLGLDGQRERGDIDDSQYYEQLHKFITDNKSIHDAHYADRKSKLGARGTFQGRGGIPDLPSPTTQDNLPESSDMDALMRVLAEHDQAKVDSEIADQENKITTGTGTASKRSKKIQALANVVEEAKEQTNSQATTHSTSEKEADEKVATADVAAVRDGEKSSEDLDSAANLIGEEKLDEIAEAHDLPKADIPKSRATKKTLRDAGINPDAEGLEHITTPAEARDHIAKNPPEPDKSAVERLSERQKEAATTPDEETPIYEEDIRGRDLGARDNFNGKDVTLEHQTTDEETGIRHELWTNKDGEGVVRQIDESGAIRESADGGLNAIHDRYNKNLEANDLDPYTPTDTPELTEEAAEVADEPVEETPPKGQTNGEKISELQDNFENLSQQDRAELFSLLNNVTGTGDLFDEDKEFLNSPHDPTPLTDAEVENFWSKEEHEAYAAKKPSSEGDTPDASIDTDRLEGEHEAAAKRTKALVDSIGGGVVDEVPTQAATAEELAARGTDPKEGPKQTAEQGKLDLPDAEDTPAAEESETPTSSNYTHNGEPLSQEGEDALNKWTSGIGGMNRNQSLEGTSTYSGWEDDAVVARQHLSSMGINDISDIKTADGEDIPELRRDQFSHGGSRDKRKGLRAKNPDHTGYERLEDQFRAATPAAEEEVTPEETSEETSTTEPQPESTEGTTEEPTDAPADEGTGEADGQPVGQPSVRTQPREGGRQGSLGLPRPTASERRGALPIRSPEQARIDDATIAGPQSTEETVTATTGEGAGIDRLTREVTPEELERREARQEMEGREDVRASAQRQEESSLADVNMKRNELKTKFGMEERFVDSLSDEAVHQKHAEWESKNNDNKANEQMKRGFSKEDVFQAMAKANGREGDEDYLNTLRDRYQFHSPDDVKKEHMEQIKRRAESAHAVKQDKAISEIMNMEELPDDVDSLHAENRLRDIIKHIDEHKRTHEEDGRALLDEKSYKHLHELIDDAVDKGDLSGEDMNRLHAELKDMGAKFWDTDHQTQIEGEHESARQQHEEHIGHVAGPGGHEARVEAFDHSKAHELHHYSRNEDGTMGARTGSSYTRKDANGRREHIDGQDTPDSVHDAVEHLEDTKHPPKVPGLSPTEKGAQDEHFKLAKKGRLRSDDDTDRMKQLEQENPFLQDPQYKAHILGGNRHRMTGEDGEQVMNDMNLSPEQQAEAQLAACQAPPGSMPPPSESGEQKAWNPSTHRWCDAEYLKELQGSIGEGEGMFMPNGLHHGTDNAHLDQDAEGNVQGVVVTKGGVFKHHPKPKMGEAPSGPMGHSDHVGHAFGEALHAADITEHGSKISKEVMSSTGHGHSVTHGDTKTASKPPPAGPMTRRNRKNKEREQRANAKTGVERQLSRRDTQGSPLTRFLSHAGLEVAGELPGYLGGGQVRGTDAYKKHQIRQATQTVQKKERAATKFRRMMDEVQQESS